MKKALLFLITCCATNVSANEPYVQWVNTSNAINKPLTNQKGNASQGRTLVIASDKGNCLACHTLPINEEPFHGNLGPDLSHIASRLSEGELRLRVVDEKQINPLSIMPGYYRNPSLFNLVANEYSGMTLLSAQEVEDVVAYLMTLK